LTSNGVGVGGAGTFVFEDVGGVLTPLVVAGGGGGAGGEEGGENGNTATSELPATARNPALAAAGAGWRIICRRGGYALTIFNFTTAAAGLRILLLMRAAAAAATAAAGVAAFWAAAGRRLVFRRHSSGGSIGRRGARRHGRWRSHLRANGCLLSARHPDADQGR